MAFKTRLSAEEVSQRIKSIDGNQLTTFVGYGTRKGNNLAATFICSCGNLHVAQVWNVLSGQSSSCGCKRRGPKKTQGAVRHHPLYATWKNMRNRCQNPKNESYPYYGARGIRVCSRWDSDFLVFASDMGPKPTPKHTIERIDNDGDYEPSNCIWATREQQALNKRPHGTVTL